MHRRIGALGALLAVVLMATGCGSTKKPAGEEGSPAAGREQTFTYADNNEIVTEWDPATSYSNEVIAMNNIYEQLLRWDSEQQKLVPLLAESYESSEDGKTWTFTLREGVKFHTGRAMDAAAAKAAIERTIEIGGGAAFQWAPVKRISAPDARTLVFDLKYAAPLDIVASSAYAAYIYDTKAAPAKRLGKWFNRGQDAGTGPYTVQEWNKGGETELRLEAFEDYWRGWEGSKYRRMVFRHVPRDTTAAQLLEAGDVTFASRLAPQLFNRVKSTRGVEGSSTPSYQNLLAMLNTASGPLKDERVRKAVSLAMDYEGLIAALKGAGVAANGIIPEGLMGHDPSLTQAQDLDQAKALLDEAGFGPDGKPLKLELTHAEGDDDQALAASLLKSSLAELNVELDVRPLQWTTQWDKAKSKDPSRRQDILVFYWYPDYADPFSWFTNLFRSADEPYFNLSYYENKELDAKIDALPELTATDREAAEEAYAEAQKIVLDDAVAMPLYVQTYLRGYRDSFKGYVDNPAYANVVFAYELEPTA